MSKYINRNYNGWKVVADLNADKKHKYFFLVETNSLNPGMIIIRDNELTALSKNKKTIDDILAAKEKTRANDSADFFAQEFMLFSKMKL